MRKTRVLFILQYFYPDVTGFSQMLGDLGEYLCETQRYECTVLTGSSVTGSRRTTKLPTTLGKIEIRRIRTFRAGKRTIVHRLLEYSAFYLGVIFSTIRTRHDIVVCFTTPPLIGLAAIVGLVFSRVPFIYYIQDLYPELLYDLGYVRNPWLIRKLAITNRLILRRATRIVTIGCRVARKISLNYQIKKQRITIIENWARDMKFVNPRLDGPFVILYSGNIGLAHDFSLLPALVDELEAAGIKNIQFRFIGGGRQYGALQKVFNRVRSCEARFCGYVERSELSHLHSDANMFLLAQSEASASDIIPSKFYSYLAGGRPILYLGTRKSDIGDRVVKRKLGVPIETKRDLSEAAAFVNKAARRDADYVAMCESIAHYYNVNLGFERSARAFDKVLREVMES